MTTRRAIHPLRQLIRPGLDVIRRLWLPFVLVQLLGLAIVFSYFHSTAVADWCDAAGRIKVRLGLPFAALAMAFASAIVPEIFKTLTGVDRVFNRNRFTTIAHNLVVFAFSGITVDLLYTGLGDWLGDSRRAPIVLTKVCIDQFAYTPLVAIPTIAFSYTLRNARYRLADALRQVDRGWYAREGAPVLIVCWAYWIPMVTLAYLLPPKLTFVYGVIASAASATLLIAIADRKRPTGVLAASAP